MREDQRLNQLIQESFQFQKYFFYGIGIICATMGIILLTMTYTIPHSPHEDSVIVYLRLSSILFLLTLPWSIWYVSRKINRIMYILGHPEEIKAIKPYRVQKNGITAYAVHIITKNEKTHGLNTTTKTKRDELVALLETIILDSKTNTTPQWYQHR